MTDWLTPTDWTTYPPSAHVVTRTELNEQIRNQLLYLYERRSPALAAMLSSLLVQDSGVAVLSALVDGVSLLNAETTLYTVPIGKKVIITGFSVWNATSTSFPTTLRLVASGTGAGIEHTVFQESLGDHEDFQGDTPWFCEAGDFFTGQAANAIADQVSCRLDGIVLSADPPGHTLRMIDGVALTASFAAMVTASGTEVVEALTVVNTQVNAGVHVDVAVVQSGGSVANAKQIFGRDLDGTLLLDRKIVLENGDSLHARATTTGVVALRPTVVRLTA